MRFEIVGKNVSITPAMKEKIESKLSSLGKYLIIDEDTIVEITIPSKIGILRTEVVNEDFYAAVDLAIDKLEDQIRRQKTRLSKRHKEHLAQAFINEATEAEEDDIPVRTKSVDAEEMELDEAIMQMELSGHNFYIYKDADSEKIAVVYARHNGGYGLIEVDE